MHLGPGAFFRAFNAVYTADAMAAGGGGWGIRAVSLRSAGPRDQLDPQGCVYTAVGLHADGARPRIIDSIVDVLVARESPERTLAALADPKIRILSLTITEKGYCHEPSSGQLDPGHPGIVADLATPDRPATAPGLLVEALSRRRQAGTPPFVVLSCDNLPGNGQVARDVVVAYARLRDPDLARWIEGEVRFPATMVDRITPATTEADITWLAETSGYLDLACVQHEPFRQWVIEDDFCAGRPDWDRAGATFTDSVHDFEAMKLRMLNGGHQVIADPGEVMGLRTVAETMAHPKIAAFFRKVAAEAA